VFLLGYCRPSLETNKRVFLARNDPRRQTASIGIYTHVRDRWEISYTRPILLNERQAGAAIEGVIRDERLETSLLAVDTQLRVLNRGESVNSLKRSNYVGRVAGYQAKQHDEMRRRSPTR
jgi:hypothetical protein